jgi:hypothetical protein
MRMDKSLLASKGQQVHVRPISGGCLVVVTAETLKYWNARLLIRIRFIPMLVVGIIVIFRNPDSLRTRLIAREREAEQKSVILAYE